MTSTTTHSSHSSHASHGSSVKGTHSNSITATPSYAYYSHTATLGGVDWTSSAPNTTQLSVYGGSGSLSQLISVVTDMRNRYASSTYNDNTSSYSYYTSTAAPSLGSSANQANLTQLLNRARATLSARYNPITAQYNVITNGTHGNTSGTSTQLAPGTAISQHSSTTGATYHLNTGSRAGYAAPVKAAVTVSPAYTVTSGTKITKAHLAGIITQLNNNTLVKWAGPSGDPGTWKLIGSNSYHSSHSSHASHSSSSKTKKHKISSIDFSALDLINTLNLVQFNYTPEAAADLNEDPEIRHYGFIAEDTPAELATQYHDRIDYTNCIGVLLKAVQELSTKVDVLESMLSAAQQNK